MESIGVAIAQAGDVREEYRRGRLQGKVLAHQPEGRGVRHCANHVLLQRSQGVSIWCGSRRHAVTQALTFVKMFSGTYFAATSSTSSILATLYSMVC